MIIYRREISPSGKHTAKYSLAPLFLMAFMQVSTEVDAQSISLDVRQASLEHVLKLIEDKTGYFVILDDERLKELKVTVKFENQSVAKALALCFEELPVTYKIVGNNLLIKQKADQPIVDQSGQEIAVRGRVVDEEGNSLSGVSVSVKGKSINVTTDNGGGYRLTDVAKEDTLVFTSVGMRRVEMSVQGRAAINVTMEQLTIDLEEVVAVGYGTVRKSDLTGSVSQLNVEGAAERSITSVQQVLQGQVSGVQVTQNTGAAGSGFSVSVRGVTSISGPNQPLIVIDGYPIETSDNSVRVSNGTSYEEVTTQVPENPLASLSPSDIESIEILKDASATAIYGSRAANGVVLITTKRGIPGKTTITGNFRYDFSRLNHKIGVLNTSDYLAYSNEAFENSGVNPEYTPEQIEELLKTNTNWQDLIYRTAGSKNYSLNVSGGVQNVRYAVMLGLLQQEGVVLNNNYDNGTVRINLDADVTNKLKVGFNMNWAKSLNQAVMQSTDRYQASGSVVTGALFMQPIQTPYNADNDLDITYQGNPLLILTKAKDANNVTSGVAILFVEYELLKGLSLNFRGGVNNAATTRRFFHPRGTLLGDLNNGYAYMSEGNSFNYLSEFTLNYNKTIAQKHRINSVTGYTWQQWRRNSYAMFAQDFPTDELTYYNFGLATIVNKPVTITQEWALASVIERLNYSYDDRYLFTFTGRYDGSTRLAEANKWSFFPSFAVGWNLHNESFLKSVSWIAEFKIRSSYGMTGNQSVGIGSTKARIANANAVMNQKVVTSYTLANMPNNELGWELSRQFDIGLDLSFLMNRYTFTVDYYLKKTEDQLISLTLPLSTGFATYDTNQGSVQNSGVDFDFAAKLLTNKVKWDLAANFSVNRNKVIDLGPGIDRIFGRAFYSMSNQYLHVAMPGQPIGTFFGYRIDGIYQNQAEVESGPTDATNPQPGDFKFRDISGPDGVPDGQITTDDREIIGNPYPDFVFGMTNNVSWKNLGVSVLIQGSVGQEVINGNRFYLDALNRGYTSNIRQEAWDNRWTGEGTSDRYPRATNSAYPFNGRFSDFIVEDASYVRVKNVMISYAFDKLRIVNRLKLFVSANNLFTITAYKGYDPEISSKGNIAMTPGMDYGSIPQFRSFSFGAGVNF